MKEVYLELNMGSFPNVGTDVYQDNLHQIKTPVWNNDLWKLDARMYLIRQVISTMRYYWSNHANL